MKPLGLMLVTAVGMGIFALPGMIFYATIKDAMEGSHDKKR